MARYLSGHIPDQPNVVVQNMPGAGSLRIPNHLYTAAPRTAPRSALSRRRRAAQSGCQPIGAEDVVRAIGEIAGPPPDLLDYMKKVLAAQKGG